MNLLAVSHVAIELEIALAMLATLEGLCRRRGGG